MLRAIGQFIDERTVDEIASSPVISLMADEATDLRNREELSVCMRYLTSTGGMVECFLDLVFVPDTTATTITSNITAILQSRNIDCSKIRWISFDGASNMSGRNSGVQAQLRKQNCPEALYVHCRSHLLQLACVYTSDKVKPIKQLFSALNSLWRLFSLSSKRTHALWEVQEVLEDPKLSLVHIGDTRWTSHYRAVNAVVRCLKSIVATLQHLHQESGDLSSEAGGLLLTFQDRRAIILLFAVKEILNPVCRLALKLQHQNAALCDIPDSLESVYSHLAELSDHKEYVQSAADFFTDCGFALLDSSKMSDSHIHTKLVKPYIQALTEAMKKRFDDKTTKMCHASSIFDPKNIKADIMYGSAELSNLASLHSTICHAELHDEWKTFRNYLKVQAKKECCMSGKEVMEKLASESDDLALTFPELSKVARIILVCPLGTATVERSFSTMSRICNRLRQRLVPENLASCIRVSVEGPNMLTTDQAAAIVRKWHSLRQTRHVTI